MTKSILVYVAGAVCTFAWLLFSVFLAWKNGHITITGKSESGNTRMFWQMTTQTIHSAIGSAAVWPLTLLFQLWLTRQYISDGGLPKITASSMSSYYPADDQANQQRNDVIASLNKMSSELPVWTNEFVFADMAIYYAAGQTWLRCRALGLSEKTWRGHLSASVAQQLDAIIARQKDLDEANQIKWQPDDE